MLQNGAGEQFVMEFGQVGRGHTQFHINDMELLAEFLANQSFVKSKRHLTVYLYLDNVLAQTYINKKGDVQS